MAYLIEDKKQFESLFRTHYAPLVGYANKMIGDVDEAADIVQNLFVGIWDKRSTIVIDGSVKSYLLRSTHNHCLNHLKHQKVKSAHVEQSQLSTSSSADHDVLEEQEFKDKVAQSIKALPPQCRKIFLMSRMQNKKYQQIADELSISVKTVENQMGKALKMLRRDLLDEGKSQLQVVKTILWFLIGVNQVSIVIN